MKIPSKDCCNQRCFEQGPQFLVSEPRKLKPKMTGVGIPVSLPDGEI